MSTEERGIRRPPRHLRPCRAASCALPLALALTLLLVAAISLAQLAGWAGAEDAGGVVVQTDSADPVMEVLGSGWVSGIGTVWFVRDCGTGVEYLIITSDEGDTEVTVRYDSTGSVLCTGVVE